MNYVECFRAIARHRSDEIVITSAGNSSQAWWAATRDSVASFYLDASMSLSTMFASGLALAQPSLKIWAFMGDGAFAMNPGMLMVERQMNLPNLTHFLVSNRVYGATSNAGLPNAADNDYAAIARAFGLERVFTFRDLKSLERDFPALKAANAPGHTFVVLEVERFSDAEQKLEQPPFDGPELKIWAFMGDGAFAMNPGMLMVERQMNLPNLTHFLVSNRVYGATSNAGLPNAAANDYAAIARGFGLKRVFEFRDLKTIDRDLPALKASNAPGHTFVVLEVEPFSDAEQKLEQPPFDGPELKFRFGRHVESRTGCDIFGYRI